MALGPGARWHSWQWRHPLHLHLLLLPSLGHLTDPTTLRGQQRSYHPILQVKRLRLWEGWQEHEQLGGTKASSEEGQGSPHFGAQFKYRKPFLSTSSPRMNITSS